MIDSRPQGVELADVIRELRDELKRAMAAADGEALRFELGPVDLEVTVELEKEAAAGGKLRFWVVEASAEAKRSSASIQRIQLTLHPRLGTAANDTSQTVYVGGAAVPGER